MSGFKDRFIAAQDRLARPERLGALAARGGALLCWCNRCAHHARIDGRQLTLGEKAYIEQACRTAVAPARYWVNAQGLGGFEGRPATFNLALCGPPPGQRSGGSSTRTFCDPDGSCRSTGILGSILTAPR